MRTTLKIDDDVMIEAQARAVAERRPVGAVISDLARQGLDRSATSIRVESQPTSIRTASMTPRTRSGIPLLPGRPDHQTVTLEIVNAMRDALD